jgi:hypothetical protein
MVAILSSYIPWKKPANMLIPDLAILTNIKVFQTHPTIQENTPFGQCSFYLYFQELGAKKMDEASSHHQILHGREHTKNLGWACTTRDLV